MNFIENIQLINLIIDIKKINKIMLIIVVMYIKEKLDELNKLKFINKKTLFIYLCFLMLFYGYYKLYKNLIHISLKLKTN